MNGSLLESARTMLADVISLGQTRFELFSVELREELARIATLLIGGLAALVLALLGIAFAAFALIVAVDPQYRLLTVCLVAVGFFAAAALLGWTVLRFARIKRRAFGATLAELRRDYEASKPGSSAIASCARAVRCWWSAVRRSVRRSRPPSSRSPREPRLGTGS